VRALHRAGQVAALVLACAVPPAQALPVHAHRGGPTVNGVATHPENGLQAFEAAAQRHDVLELDTRLTSDGVPVVMHDAKLDRTTTCDGLTKAFSLADLGACRIDTPVADDAIPTLEQVLQVARRANTRVDVEINDYPTDAGYAAGSGQADKVVDVVLASGLPRDLVTFQSFLAAPLDTARRRMPGARTAQILFNAPISAILPAARAKRTYVFPQWPVTRAFVRLAHRNRLKVVPYTVNTTANLEQAAKIRVDGVITDDPPLARTVTR
jgi:glycerophosphoryl diester phosphodiesterase